MRHLILILGVWLLAGTAPAHVDPDVVIIRPAAYELLPEPHQQRLDQAMEWLGTWLSAAERTCRTLTVSDLEELVALQPRQVIVLQYERWPSAAWKALETYLKQGGTVIWNGTTARQASILRDDHEALKRLAGVDLQGYTTDPQLGKGKIDRYMWLAPQPPLDWQGERNLLAVFAGEAIAMQATGDGKAAADWIRRDKSTSDGTACVVRTYEGGGRSIALGTYTVLTAALDNESLPRTHARELLAHLLALGEGDQASLRPINLTPLPGQPETARSMWVWSTRDLLRDGSDTFFEFCQRRRIELLFLYTGGEILTSQREALAALVSRATAAGIVCHGLDGWPKAMLADDRARFLASAQRVVAYNAAVPAEARLRGFQTDIEPVTLEQYHRDATFRTQADAAYVSLHRDCRDVLQQASPPVVLGAAVPEARADEAPWKVAGILPVVDYVAVMSYHDRAHRVARAVSPILRSAAANGCQVWVGVETLDVASMFSGSRSITFHEEGVLPMEDELAALGDLLADDALAGIAIHTYRSYVRLPQRVDWDYGLGALEELIALPEPITITGTLDDLSQVRYQKQNWQGPQDNSVTYRVSWRADLLTIEADIVDDTIIAKAGEQRLWEHDHLNIWLAEDAQSTAWQIGIGADGESWIWHPENAPAIPLQVEHAPTTNGYMVRCRLPVAELGFGPLQADRTLRLAVEVGDADTLEERPGSMLSSAPQLAPNRPASFPILRLLEAP